MIWILDIIFAWREGSSGVDLEAELFNILDFLEDVACCRGCATIASVLL